MAKVKGVTVNIEDNQAKWQYVLKTALLFSFIQANLIQFIKLLLCDVTIDFETKLQIICTLDSWNWYSHYISIPNRVFIWFVLMEKRKKKAIYSFLAQQSILVKILVHSFLASAIKHKAS